MSAPLFTDPHEVTFRGLTRIQNRVLCALTPPNSAGDPAPSQTEAYLFSSLGEQGWAREDIDAAIDTLLDGGWLWPSVSTYDERFGHVPTLRRIR